MFCYGGYPPSQNCSEQKIIKEIQSEREYVLNILFDIVLLIAQLISECLLCQMSISKVSWTVALQLLTNIKQIDNGLGTGYEPVKDYWYSPESASQTNRKNNCLGTVINLPSKFSNLSNWYASMI